MSAPRGLLTPALAGLLAGVMVQSVAPKGRRAAKTRVRARPARGSTPVAQELNRGAGLLALSVLADSAVEHYRGSFRNRAMFAPLASSALALGASAYGMIDKRPGRHRLRDLVYAGAAATGFVGLAFHAYNIGKRPGGLSWLNLFYSAPIGAPSALALSGLLGRGAEKVRDAAPGERPRIFGLPAGRLLAAVSSVGLFGTVAEAALLHFRGAFHDPFMFVPVTVPPAAALATGVAAAAPTAVNHARARRWLKLTALAGFLGAGFHVFGVARNMGGWRNWRQNVLNGPPIPAPPSFTGLALAGLAALSLEEGRRDV